MNQSSPSHSHSSTSSNQSSPNNSPSHDFISYLPLSNFSSLPLTSSLASTTSTNSPPRAKPTVIYLPTFEKSKRVMITNSSSFNSNSNHNHRLNHNNPISYFVCSNCGTHLSQTDELISKAFSGRDGKAYLFQSTINTILGKHEQRELLTGLHTVADLRCKGCERSVGWTYIKAHENNQKYKEGKFIMERAALHKENNWS